MKRFFDTLRQRWAFILAGLIIGALAAIVVVGVTPTSNSGEVKAFHKAGEATVRPKTLVAPVTKQVAFKSGSKDCAGTVILLDKGQIVYLDSTVACGKVS